ncbi:MAG: O-antigen ligase family protein [Patescibacteria group bacterium]|nr:O-antigen ligase family protein [Patescibacteria group bacterium]
MPKDRIIKLCDFIITCGFCAIVFLVPLIFNFALNTYSIFGPLREAVFRAILSLILAAYIAKIFIQGRINIKGGGKIFLFSFLLLVSCFISSLLSIQPHLSFWGSYERGQGFYCLANYWLFFILLILNLRDLKQVRRLIATAVMAGAAVSLYGLIQLGGLDPWLWRDKVSDTGRVFSSLGQPNFLGHYLVLIIPLSCYAWLFIARKFLVRFCFSLVVIAELICLVYTYSRAAWLGFLAAAALAIFFWLFQQGHRKIAWGFAGALVLAAALAIGINIVRPAPQGQVHAFNFVSRWTSMVDLQSGSNKLRLAYWQDALKEIRQASYQRLLLGYGPDTLAEVFIKYYRPDWAVYEVINTFPDRAHNWLFDTILSFGLAGLAAMLWFYAYFIYQVGKFLFGRAAKLREEVWLAVALVASLAAYCINNLFSFSLTTSFVYLFFILALLWFIISGRQEKEFSVKLTPVSKILIWLTLAVVAVLFFYSENFNPLMADYYYLQVKIEERKGDCRGVLDNMERAVDYYPSSVFYKEQYIFYGQSCFFAVPSQAGRLALRDNIEEQINSLESVESRYVSRLAVARAYASFGFYVNKAYYAKAQALYDKLFADYPYFLTFYQDFARMKVWQEDYAGAMQILKQAERLFPPLDHPQLNEDHKRQIKAEEANFYEIMGFASTQAKAYDQALKYYKMALALDPYRVTLYKNLADIHYLKGELDQAIALNQRGFMLNPADYHWPLALFLLYRDKQDLGRAREYLSQALKLAPENAELKKYQQELNSKN